MPSYTGGMALHVPPTHPDTFSPQGKSVYWVSLFFTMCPTLSAVGYATKLLFSNPSHPMLVMAGIVLGLITIPSILTFCKNVRQWYLWAATGDGLSLILAKLCKENPEFQEYYTAGTKRVLANAIAQKSK